MDLLIERSYWFHSTIVQSCAAIIAIFITSYWIVNSKFKKILDEKSDIVSDIDHYFSSSNTDLMKMLKSRRNNILKELKKDKKKYRDVLQSVEYRDKYESIPKPSGGFVRAVYIEDAEKSEHETKVRDEKELNRILSKYQNTVGSIKIAVGYLLLPFIISIASLVYPYELLKQSTANLLMWILLVASMTLMLGSSIFLLRVIRAMDAKI
ncbi:MAG TPA: hypothetical protein ENH10_03335 [Bacteroidetes bacterium]|nr:hypothetical protein BMS3Bbin04_01926 [bacterium BMS3Bbin04]HDO65049.1 hypothetical protein [Bacteroidota bacterium]HEX04174.1 hypothetical protein [Bacteroidota bacterium]